MTHYDKHNILTNIQHGFRSGYSCKTQLINTYQDLYQALDNNIQTDIAILDFSKAFDVVPHKRLMHKLHHYGIRGSVHKWIGNFLQNRKQCVVVDNTKSSSVRVTSGVPQGTCLGPILFLTYINDISTNVNCQIRLFADDCLLYKTIKSEQDQLTLQHDLNTLEQWSKTWGMSFNPSKCYILSTSKKDPKHHRFYTLCGEVLEHHTDNAYLGVLLNQHISFTNHINNINSKANSTLGFLSRNLRRCPPKLRETAYKSLVRSKLEYASIVWDPHQQKDIDKLERTQRKAARFVYRDYSRNTSVTELLRKLQWSPLAERRRQQRLVFMYKILNGHVKGLDTENVLVRNTNKTRRGASGNCFNIINAKSQQYKHSYYPRTIRDWNPLPDNSKNQTTINGFKAAITPQLCY